MNNPRLSSPGRVDQFPALQIRTLKALGLLQEGKKSEGWREVIAKGEVWHTHWVELDLTEETGEGLIIRNTPQANTGQWVGLASRAMRLGGHRWSFLCPITGAHCETLYFLNGQLASAKGHGLRYASQSEGRLKRYLRKREKLEQRLEGGDGRGPARGAPRRAAQRELDQIDEDLDTEGRMIVARVALRAARAQARRDALDRRVQAFAEAIRATPTVSNGQSVVQTFSEWLAVHPPKRRRAGSLKRGARPPGELLLERPYLDTLILGKLGYLRDGELSGEVLSWPPDWIAQEGRITNLLIDLRAPKAPAALIIHDDPDELVFQPIQLARVRGDFGKDELMFVCAEAKVITRVLLYDEGRFASMEAISKASADKPAAG